MTRTKARKRLAGTTKRLAEAVRSSRRDIAAIKAHDELTEEAKRSAIDARREELRNEVDAIEEGAKEAVVAIQSAAPKPLAIDPLEAMRVWQRHQRELESGADPTAITQRLVAERDRVGLQVLAEELPSYLRAQGHGESVEPVLVEIRAAETPLLTEEEAAHWQEVSTADAAMGRVKTNTGLVRIDGETADVLVGIGDQPDVVHV